MQKIIKNILAQVIRLCLVFPVMNATLEEQLEYAKAMLEVLDPSLKLMKPEFRQAAARQLVYIAEQIAATMSLAEAVIEPEPESSKPAEPQVKMPKPPAGCRWEYRGKGWKSENPVFYAFATPYETYKGESSMMAGYPLGEDRHHYWESVPLTPEPAEPDRPVIDLAIKYRTRDGREVTGLKYTSEDDEYPFFGKVNGIWRGWTNQGYWADETSPHPLDLIPTGETV